MITFKLFDRIDHLMIEVDDPRAIYEDFYKVFALPQAWPLMTTERYTSIGVNFGNANIELIAFKERFGVKNTDYVGLSGVSLVSQAAAEKIKDKLKRKNISLLEGEDTQQYQTYVIAGKEAPTVFVCHYKFNTDGWQARLNEDFKKSNGGRFNLSRIVEVGINTPLLEHCAFEFSQPDSVRLRRSDIPEVRLRSTQANMIGKSVVLGGTLFSFC